MVDATCDLPPEFLAAHGIRVMPIGIRLGEQRLIDRRDPDTTLSFYRDHLPKVGSKDGSQPLSAAELQQWFLDELVTDFDYVVCLTVDSLRSPIFEHATQASFGLLQHYHERRHAAGIAGPFTLRVLDSHSVFAGIACLAAEGTRLLAQGSHPNALRTRLEQLSQQTCTYLVADDLGHLRRRGFQKGDRSGFVDRVKGAALGLGSLLDVKPVFSLADGEDKPVALSPSFEKSAEKLFGYALARVQAGELLAPQLGLSYAGDPTALRDLPGFAALENACRERDIRTPGHAQSHRRHQPGRRGHEPGLHRRAESLCLRPTRGCVARPRHPPPAAARASTERAGPADWRRRPPGSSGSARRCCPNLAGWRAGGR